MMHTNSRRPYVLGLMLCGALGAPLGAQQRPLVEVRFPAFTQAIRTDTLVYGWERLEGSPAQVFAAVQAAYKELGLDVDFIDQSRTAVSTLRMRAPRRVDGKRMSTYLSCGRNMTGENADTHRLTIALVTYLQEDSPTVTAIGTGMTGMVQDLSGASNEPLPCESLNVLEAR